MSLTGQGCLLVVKTVFAEEANVCCWKLSVYLDLLHNKPYSTAKRKNSGTGRTRL